MKAIKIKTFVRIEVRKVRKRERERKKEVRSERVGNGVCVYI